jgi:16S rRNA (guanine527-N7)-methyltransferase
VTHDDRVDVALEVDPWEGDVRLPGFFGESWTAISAFHTLLVDEGVRRGLVGPREVPRLWERHLLNSAVVVPYLPEAGRIIDLGSGAGLPGIVVAAMRPGAEVVLLDPMERRTDWLLEVVAALGLPNVVVLRARAEDVHRELSGVAVTARAVAPLDHR